MRIVVYTAGVLIVLAAAWDFYLNDRIQQFEVSLSEVPATPTTQQELQQEVPDDVLNSDDPIKAEDFSAIAGDVIWTDADAELSEMYSSSEAETIWTDADAELSVDAETGVSEETITPNEETPIVPVVGACGEVCEPSESGVDILSLSKDEQREFFREGLIRRLGDTPEVHRFIHYMKLAHNNQTISEEEALENARVITTLFPNKANKRHLQELELRAASRRAMQR
jgi:hypothetical protein